MSCNINSVPFCQYFIPKEITGDWYWYCSLLDLNWRWLRCRCSVLKYSTPSMIKHQITGTFFTACQNCSTLIGCSRWTFNGVSCQILLCVLCESFVSNIHIIYLHDTFFIVMASSISMPSQSDYVSWNTTGGLHTTPADQRWSIMVMWVIRLSGLCPASSNSRKLSLTWARKIKYN